MQSKVTIYGHPVHPMIIVLPLGLLPASVFADLFHHIIDDPTWGSLSFWLMVAGVLSGLAAGAIGFMDWRSLPVATKARRVGAIHGLTNVVAIVVFLASLLLRFGDPSRPSPFATSVAIIGLFIAFLGGWLGGELVFRLGVGVHQTEDSSRTPERPNLEGQRGPVHPRRQPRRRYSMNSNHRGNRPLLRIRTASP